MRPLTPPASLISLAASAIPSRTLTPQGVKVLLRSVSMPILIGPDGAVVGASVAAGACVAAGAEVAAGACVGAGASVVVAAGAPHAARIMVKISKTGKIRKVI